MVMRAVPEFSEDDPAPDYIMLAIGIVDGCVAIRADHDLLSAHNVSVRVTVDGRAYDSGYEDSSYDAALRMPLGVHPLQHSQADRDAYPRVLGFHNVGFSPSL